MKRILSLVLSATLFFTLTASAFAESEILGKTTSHRVVRSIDKITEWVQDGTLEIPEGLDYYMILANDGSLENSLSSSSVDFIFTNKDSLEGDDIRIYPVSVNFNSWSWVPYEFEVESVGQSVIDGPLYIRLENAGRQVGFRNPHTNEGYAPGRMIICEDVSTVDCSPLLNFPGIDAALAFSVKFAQTQDIVPKLPSVFTKSTNTITITR
jgi:hypothetical protein